MPELPRGGRYLVLETPNGTLSMVRLFHVYYPVGTLVLMVCEAAIVGASFVAATLLVLRSDSYRALNYWGGTVKIAGVIVLALLCSYYLDLYEPQHSPSRSAMYFRLMAVVGALSLILAIITYLFPKLEIEPRIPLLGLIILAPVLVVWRRAYDWAITQPLFREHVYVLGSGDRAQRAVEAIRSRPDLGMDVVAWVGAIGNGSLTRDDFATAISTRGNRARRPDRIILALQDRRGAMPARELLDLRLAGTKIEDVNVLLEKISGKLEVDGLHPSAMIFGDGFQVRRLLTVSQRLVSILVAGSALLIALPLIPLIALAVKISSPGPVVFGQKRWGCSDEVFTLYKFRTMYQHAEAVTGAVWADKNDPRITAFGRVLRKTHLDEIPQLWNVLKDDMAIVGPRPERPEFVQRLTEKIPYYKLRHIVRPGLTGWAQVRYQYAATIEETKKKLEYDLYYIKHMSLALDLLIILETLKLVIAPRRLQRGSTGKR